jgi:hypothetical protein
MGRAGRTIRIVVTRQQHEALWMTLGQCGYPLGLGGDVWSGEAGIRDKRADRGVESSPLRQKGRGVIALRPHSSPAAEPVRFIADLERQKIGADYARNIGGFRGGFFRRAACEIEPVDELPAQHPRGRRKPIDVRRRHDEAPRRSWLRLGAPYGAFAGVAADADHAVFAERSDQSEDGAVVRREIIAGGKDRGFVAEPDEVRRHGRSRVLIGNGQERSPIGLRARGRAGEKSHGRAGHTAQEAATLDGQGASV